MNSLEYRRLSSRPERQPLNGAIDWIKLLKRLSWLAASLFLIERWQLHHIPRNCYAACAIVALIVFISTFSYIVIDIRRQFGYSESAPSHGRWKHYAPRAVVVMSVSSFLFFCFAVVAFYHRLGLIAFPGIAMICYGFSCMLSYL